MAVMLHVLIWLLIGSVHCQINSIPGSSQTTFYLDASSDCDGRIRNVGQSTVNIFGKTTVAQGKPLTSCTVTLKTDNVREPYRFKLQFLAVTIYDPGVQLYVYDGEFNGRLRWAFNKNSQKPESLTFDFTTGQFVTFRLSRDELDKNYDIRIVATPVRSDVARCTYENEYDCDEYGYNYRLLGTKEIVGIVAGCTVLVVVVIIVVVCCYRKQRGISQKRKVEKLYHVNNAASLHSLGNDNKSIPVKRDLPPTPVSNNPKDTCSRSGLSQGLCDHDSDNFSEHVIPYDNACRFSKTPKNVPSSKDNVSIEETVSPCYEQLSMTDTFDRTYLKIRCDNNY